MVNTVSVQAAIINFYFLFFGVTLALTQLNIHKIVDKFRFLNYHWGKSLFSLFLASMSFNNKEEMFVQYIITIYFFVCSFLFLILAVIDRAKDKEQY
jgi:hypothetical protein